MHGMIIILSRSFSSQGYITEIIVYTTPEVNEHNKYLAQTFLTAKSSKVSTKQSSGTSNTLRSLMPRLTSEYTDVMSMMNPVNRNITFRFSKIRNDWHVVK